MTGVIHKGRKVFGLKARCILRIDLEIKLALKSECEKQAIGIDPMATKHALHANPATGSKKLGQILRVEAAHKVQAPASASGATGVMAMESPQPQADVWLGFSKTNLDESLSVR